MEKMIRSAFAVSKGDTEKPGSARHGAVRYLLGGIGIIVLLGAISLFNWFTHRYAVEQVMNVPLEEQSRAQYPENPANLSDDYGRYNGRTLELIQRDERHFDFIFNPTNSHTAKVVFKDIDVSLFVPKEPKWTSEDPDLETIAFTDREWNRQQVSFPKGSSHLDVSGGNGYETANLYSADLSNNCLNAGLWEMLLFTNDGGKKLYYQAWFTFPLGHYKRIFEDNNHRSYWKNWRRLEHWVSPQGTHIALSKLRNVLSEKDANAKSMDSEPILVSGEQRTKLRTLIASNLLTWKDFVGGNRIEFAAFLPPGRYYVNHPWKNEYWRIVKFEKALLRDIKSPASPKTLKELELVFEDAKTHRPTRFIVSGFDPDSLPQVSNRDYPKGLYMPMGIGVPPFFQSYEDLEKTPPDTSPYFSVLLDEHDNWLNHHEIAIDGPVIHRDLENPNLLHVYLLSYERHSLITHIQLPL